ncbi:Uncharacterised protein [uncultured archaeon]|nr:Uncharacterised protein [uncultured archaeon]
MVVSVMPRILYVLAAVLAVGGLLVAAPVGAEVNAGTPVTLGSGPVGSVEAWGGNVTFVNLQINSTTLHWQAFYGNITAGLRLASNQSGTTYTVKSWTVDSLRGVVFVSRSSNINFANLSSVDPAINSLDTAFPFLSGANDRANNTGSDNANPAMTVGPYSITAGSRPIIQTNNGQNQASWTQVVLNYGDVTSAEDYVFAVPINASGNAYDNSSANYQVMVPANATVGSSVTYYFYGEIQ